MVQKQQEVQTKEQTQGNERALSNFVSIQNLAKTYPNGVKAVYDFNLDIQKNEFIVIVGPSGCGKTTALRMISGLEDITSGEIYVDRELVNYKPSKDRRMAIVFQSYALYPQMSVFDNIAFPLTINAYRFPIIEEKLLSFIQAEKILKEKSEDDLLEAIAKAKATKSNYIEKDEAFARIFAISIPAADLLLSYNLENLSAEERKDFIAKTINELEGRIAEEKKTLEAKNIKVDEACRQLDKDGKVLSEMRKMNKAEIRQRVFQAAVILDLGPYLDRLPKELSGGQMQRVALGRAIVKDVPLFLMDEPLSNLDAKLRLTMRSEIVKLHRKIGATTIYVTHDQTEAMTMASRIVVMSKGFVQQIGTPEKIYDDPDNLFVAKFIGSPAINLFAGTYEKGTTIAINEGLQLGVPANFKAITDAFYKAKLTQYQNAYDHYDDPHSQELILKMLSSLGKENPTQAEKKQKANWLKKLFAKKGAPTVNNDPVKATLEATLEALKKAQDGPREILCAIRPERMNVEIVKEGDKKKDGYPVTPTVCELLGNEYIVHFDFLGRDMTAKLGRKSHVNLDSKLLLSFDKNDLLFFDGVTGERIRL
jgi:ABC-type sugar transport system ATPase subunit